MTHERMTVVRRAEIKMIAACVPFIDNGAGVAETQKAFAELLRELAAVEAENRRLLGHRNDLWEASKDLIHDQAITLMGRVGVDVPDNFVGALSAAVWNVLNDKKRASAHVTALTAENERLREALNEIRLTADKIQSISRAALDAGKGAKA